MRNIFLFIRRYFNFLFFLALQVLALSFLFRYNRYHEAAFMSVASEITGSVNTRYNTVEYYFKLKKANESLVQENVHLRELLRSNYQGADTTRQLVVDSIRVDSLVLDQKYFYRDAKVVGSFVTTQTNFFTLHRGLNQGVNVDMGVIGPRGVVGRIVNVSSNFSTVMTMLSRQFKVDAKLKTSGDRGTISWDGISPQFVQMRNIPKNVKINKGDSVITSELSSIFPANILVGTVDTVVNDPSTNFLTLRLRSATNFSTVQHVYIVQNKQLEEQRMLEANTRKTNE
ncbi:rod shape-determining protein MreC [Flavihumibacter solisilvae]|uniref:Cell shape-determining protein MreC n=1 Tax=Flavihumibacter solisilvae TaxID=1349421 RepID=A0A0C1L3J1_9BACT|nr:rod shape-determining protein MreC [Flavihumibacter solisilvae]KIC94562.1 rod shape-determining protein MreC [Flavihumibacter solisilvae]